VNRLFCSIAIATALIAPAVGHEFTYGSIVIVHPHLEATAPAARTGVGFITFKNNGAVDDRLISIETDAAAMVRLERSEVIDGIARMHELAGGLALPAESEVVLGDDGTHAMFVGITAPFAEGELVDATLIFERAGRFPMYFEVVAPGEPHSH
jgi:copper(I)-binding protein